MGILSIITGLSDFKTKLDEYQNESMSRLDKGDRHHFFIPFLILVST